MDKRKKIKVFIATAVSLSAVSVFLLAGSGLSDLCRFHFFACGSSANLNASADHIGDAPSENQNSTIFQTATVEPNKIKVGETQTTRVEIASVAGVEKVSAQIPFEGSYDEIVLRLVSGNERQGVWEGQWVAHNTLAKEYKTKIIAVDRDGKVVETEASWWDDTETAWYDQNWSNRKKATIANSAGALTNYQVKVTIPYQRQMQPDFDDIRFTAADGKTPLDFWCESKTDSTTAIFWVEAASLSASANTNIYYYYGNAGVSTTSSDTNTFVRVIGNLVGGWDMNEGSGTTAHDKSGNGNDGAISGATFTTDRNGNANQALNFDGVDDYADMGGGTSLKFYNSSAFSMNVWFKTTKTDRADILSRFKASIPYNGYMLSLNRTTAGKLDLYTGTAYTDIGSDLNNGNWHNAISIIHGNNTISFYLDGIKVLSDQALTQDTDSDVNLIIGRYQHTDLNFFQGSLDDVHIYNRALTADEIADVYSASHATLIAPSKVLVRNYVSGEPTVSIATQEENEPNRPGAIGTSGGPMMF